MAISLRAPDARFRPQRRDRRFPVSLWAVEHTGPETYHHRVTNLSLTGMFLQKSVPIPLGTTFRLEIALPTGHTIRGRGTVIHATETEEGPGNGVTLSNLFEEDRDALRDYLASVPVH